LIDFVALAFTIVGFSRITGSYVAGLVIGYVWLAFSDSGGSLGKWALKLEVRDRDTGRECSAWASFVRNLPIIAIALPHRLHQALLGVNRQQYRDEHSAFLLGWRAFFGFSFWRQLSLPFAIRSVITSAIILHIP
jgi:hypothetical protein